MRRAVGFVLSCGLVFLIIALAMLPSWLPAQTDKNNTRQVEQSGTLSRGAVAPLPIKKVLLFTSGVGYFQREGKVKGDTEMAMAFPVGDVNDLLKSLMLRDLDGGQIRAVNFDSVAPIDKALKGYAVNLSDNPDYGSILNQTRGERVEVNWLPAEAKISSLLVGTIMGVQKEKKLLDQGRATVTVEFLNLWTGDGIKNLKLSDVTSVRFLNSNLNAEVEQALQVVSRSHDVQLKNVSLQFRGQGERQVEVGYVVEHPVWRTSYRLVLDGKDSAFLQGWGIVENPTNEDWNGVQVGLVSGRPISYRMDLYQPLYVNRPMVQLPQFANLQPRSYEGLLEEERAAERQQGGQRGRAGMPPAQDAAGAPAPGYANSNRAEAKKSAERWDRDQLQQSTPAMAQGQKQGAMFRYDINEPVNVPRQKSAMLPIISSDIAGKRLSIYNAETLATNPLRGMKLKNTSKLHLMQGPITVYEGDSYAGDALIQDLQPGEERLISYAVDLATEVDTQAKEQPQELVSVFINKGILVKQIKQRKSKIYKVKNRGEENRLVLIQHPDSAPTFNLITPKEPVAKTRNYLHFEMSVPAGELKSLEVVEERKILQETALTNVDDQTVALLVKNQESSPALKKALQKAMDLKDAVAQTQRKIGEVNRELEVITKDQSRQRDNMKVIPQTEPIYKKYLDKFIKQEERIDTLREQMQELQTQMEQQRSEYEAFVRNLTVPEGKKE